MTTTVPPMGVLEPTSAHFGAAGGRALYFGRTGNLFAWYHEPPDGVARLECAIVLCPPLGYEELCVHRVLRHWAVALANAGVATLRFDYHGTGNSGGTDTDAERVAAWVESVVDAAGELRRRAGAPHVVLAGIRLGATLAMAAARQVVADGLIAFASPPTGRAYVRELRAFGRLTRSAPSPRESAGDDGAEEAGGFVMARETLESLTTTDPLAGQIGVRRALVIPRDDVAVDITVAERLSAQGTVVERAVVPGYAAMMRDAHEALPPRAVFDASIAWLSTHYGACAGVMPRPAVAVPTSGRCEIDPSVHERAISFGRDTRLFGVLTEPADASMRRVRTGVVLANAGSVHHTGPGRMYVTFAREWAGLGLSVLRMDIAGVGDSDTHGGAADNHPYPERATDDIACAVSWLREQGECDRVVVAGLCSGAHASFHAGLEHAGIDGVIAINPIVFYWTSDCALDVAVWMNYAESQRYSRSARRLGSWMRVLRGEVRIGYAATVVYRRAREVAGGAVGSFVRRLGLRSERHDVAADLARLSTRGVTTLLVFSEGDPGLDFVRRRYSRDVRRLERDSRNFAMRVIGGADHTFTRSDARDRLRQVLTTHLMDRHRA